MFRVLFGATNIISRSIAKSSKCIPNSVIPKCGFLNVNTRNLCSVINHNVYPHKPLFSFQTPKISNQVSRTVTKWSYTKGKRKSVAAVLKRFYRLRWGGWIRRKCGCKKHLWMKSPPRKRRLRQHVFCNATQSTLLDKMTGKYWRKPKYYVDDPYEPYHSREEFVFTSKKPRPYIPPEDRL